MKRSGSHALCLSGAWELDTCLYLENHKLHLGLKDSRYRLWGGWLILGHASLCQKESLPTLGFSLSSHLLCSLSQCPICSASLLSCDLSSASLLDPVYDKTSPSTLTKALKLDSKLGMKKVDLYCLLLPHVHFIT